MEPEFYAYYNAVEDRHWWFIGRREIILRILERELASSAAERRLLDVGCGTGTMIGRLSCFGMAEGVDVEPEAVRFCHRRGIAAASLFDGRNLPFDDDTFDVVSGFDVIEHVDDDVQMLSEMRRVLRPDGVLILTVPAFPSLWGPQDEISHHKRRYRRAELRDHIASAGLSIRRLTYFNSALFVPIAAVRMVRPQRPGSAQLRSDFEMNKPGRLNNLLGRIFAAEASLVARINLPVGVSLLALAKPIPGDAERSDDPSHVA